MILAAAGTTAFAAEKTKEPAAHEHVHEGPNKYQSLIDAAADSVKKGQACLQHCICAVELTMFRKLIKKIPQARPGAGFYRYA